MTKKKTNIKFDEFDDLKREISTKVKDLAPNAGKNDPRRCLRFPVDGCRNYELESDGTLWMCYGGKRNPHNRWNGWEWSKFQDDCVSGLWARLEAFCK